MPKTRIRLPARQGSMAAIILACWCSIASAQDISPSASKLRVLPRPTTDMELRETEISPPTSVPDASAPDSVILKPGSSSTVLRKLRVQRRFTVSQLRANPVMALGDARVDFTPVLANPQAPINIAGKLRERPGLVEVVGERTEAMQIDKGLVLRQFLSFRIKPGVCANLQRRMALSGSGISCPVRMTPQSRAAAFGNPADPHFIADRRKRNQAIQDALRVATDEQEQIKADIAQFRGMMQNPEQRARVQAEIGPQELTRLSAMNDAQLEQELIATGVTQIEEVMFIPSQSRARLSLSRAAMAGQMHRVRPAAAASLQPREAVELTHPLEEYIFLTGFTLGRENEWHKTVKKSVKWCVVGCKKTYYLKLYTGFDYGFGLRFPIQMGGLYQSDGGNSASATFEFRPVNADENQYLSTGLSQDQLFQARELVAELEGYAGIAFKVPILGTGGISHREGKNLADSLPAPFTGGQFQPPEPGAGNIPAAAKVFDDVDLIGGLADYGIVGGRIHPSVKLGLSSQGLQMKFTDDISGAASILAGSGQTRSLTVDSADKSSRFTISDPVYNLEFEVTPGITARLFVDIAVWGHNWDWPVWFPELTIQLPPQGRDFACHPGTVCTRHYNYSPTQQTSQGGDAELPDDPVEAQVAQWAVPFEKRWKAQCPAEQIHWCEVAMSSLTERQSNIMISEMKDLYAKLPLVHAVPAAQTVFDQRTQEAEQQAVAIFRDSLNRVGSQ